MDRRSFTGILIRASATGLVLAATARSRAQKAESPYAFIKRGPSGHLMRGNQRFRFVGVNMPEVTHIRTDWDIEQANRFRLPTLDEIDWMVEAAAQANFRVIRTWCFPSHLQRENPVSTHYFHLNSDGLTVQLNEAGFVLFDYFLAKCRKLGVYAQVPFVYLYKSKQWAGASGLPHPQLLDFVRKVVTRINSLTGVAYRDDPTIFCWESGNEAKPTTHWIAALASYVKSIDPNHLFMDGRWGATDIFNSYSDPVLATNTDIDIVSVHTYEERPLGLDQTEAIKALHALLRKQGKSLDVGEIDPKTSVPELAGILTAVVENDILGASWWSSKGARAKGGYTQWNGRRWGGNDDLKWPGFESSLKGVSTEKAKIDLLCTAAYAIEGRRRPGRLPVPTAAKLLPICDVGHISWIPGTGEQTALIERARSSRGVFTPIARVETFKGSTYDLFCDTTAELGRDYYYRIVSENTGGKARRSNVVGPVRVNRRWVVDDLWDFSKVVRRSPECRIISDYELSPYHGDLSVLTTDGDLGSLDYKVSGVLSSIRVISNNDTETLMVEGSVDNKKWQQLSTLRKIYAPLHDEFSGHPRVVYTSADLISNAFSYVRVRIGREDVVSRIEISHV